MAGAKMPRQTCTTKSPGLFVNPAEQAHRYAKISKKSLPRRMEFNRQMKALDQFLRPAKVNSQHINRPFWWSYQFRRRRGMLAFSSPSAAMCSTPSGR